ncbi:MAG: DUF2283 domain-containing protein [Gemmatimonadetes bacterium]|nr:DUF2283 domain-containing protein [Gemmatimonadota bacterium]
MISLQVTYRKGQPFAAYICLDHAPGQKAVRSEEVAREIVVDYDGDERPIGVEIVSPGATSVDEILAVFDELGLSRPDLSELAPLVAA